MSADLREIIRVATESDAPGIRAIYAPIVEATAISFEIELPTVEDMRERIGTTLQKYPWLVVDDGREILGYAYAGQFQVRAAYRWSVGLSAYVKEGFRGRGLGRALLHSVVEIITKQGFVRALGGITLPNPASVRLVQSLGFTPVGILQNVGYKLGSWHDVGWWQRILAEPVENPPEPIPFRDLAHDEISSFATRS